MTTETHDAVGADVDRTRGITDGGRAISRGSARAREWRTEMPYPSNTQTDASETRIYA